MALPLSRLTRLIKSKSRLRPVIIGTLHLDALPGTPLNQYTVDKISLKACRDAEIYNKYGLDGIIVENTNDLPYLPPGESGPELVSCMTRLCLDVRKAVDSKLILGTQLLCAHNREALAVASTCGYDFIRVEGFTYSHVADEGWVNACAGQLLRYRRSIQADHVMILADIKKKHCSHAVTADISPQVVAETCEFFHADGVVVTGSKTGEAPDDAIVNDVKKATFLPVFVGSGITLENWLEFGGADGWIIGSHFKEGGLWANDLDEDKLKAFMERAEVKPKTAPWIKANNKAV